MYAQVLYTDFLIRTGAYICNGVFVEITIRFEFQYIRDGWLNITSRGCFLKVDSSSLIFQERKMLSFI